MIAFVAKQGQMLKKFRNTEYFIKNIGLSRLSIYFKIWLYKVLKKFPALKKSTLSSHYGRNNLKLIKNVCKSNANLFSYTKNCITVKVILRITIVLVFFPTKIFCCENIFLKFFQAAQASSFLVDSCNL